MAEFAKKLPGRKPQTLDDPYGVLDTASKLDPQKCKEAYQAKLEAIRKKADKPKRQERQTKSLNQAQLEKLLAKYGK